MKKTTRIIALFTAVLLLLASVSVSVFAVSAPPAPSKLTASADSVSVTLKWNKSSATGYRIFQLVNKKYVKLATVRENGFTVKNLKAATSYVFAVRAYNKQGDKVVWSKTFRTVKAKTKAPGAIAAVKAAPGDGKAVLTWSASAGAEGYAVFRYASKKWYKLGVVKSDVRKFTVTNLKNGGTYVFAVRPFVRRNNGVVWGPLSKTVCVKPKSAVSSSVQAICDRYNKAVNDLKAYKKTVKVKLVDNSEISVTDCSLEALKNMLNSMLNNFVGLEPVTDVFRNGKNNSGESLEDWVWPYGAKSALKADGVQSASLSKKDGCYYINITLKPEKSYYNAKTGKNLVPEYNGSVFGTFDVGEINAAEASVDYINMDFTRTKLAAVLDAKGRLIKLYDNAPFAGMFTIGVPVGAKKTSVTVKIEGRDNKALSVKYY